MLFFKKKIDNAEMKKAVDRMHEQIAERGGELHFTMKIDEEGWYAECREFPGIVTGGSNKNPNEEEIFRSVMDSIATAFDMPKIFLDNEDQIHEKHERSLNVSVERKFTLPNYLPC